MFGFNHTKKAFKADCAKFATPYDAQARIEKNTPAPARKRRNTLRITVCAACALALVLTGSVITPAVLNPQKSADSFEIVAYATDGKSQVADFSKITKLKQDIKISLPSARLFYDPKYHSINYTIGYVSCTGNNLNSVTYSCDMGTLDYSSTEIYQTGKNSISGKKVISKASDHHTWLVWNPSAQDYDEISTMQRAFGKINYSVICGDTITVQAKFNDGKTILRYIMISFDKKGNLCAKLASKKVPQV